MSPVNILTNHTVHIALTLAVCGVAVLFGVLHGIAAVSQLVKRKDPAPAILMLGGSLGALAAAIDCLLGGSLDWLLMLLGGATVCLAAVCNGKRAAAQKGDPALFHLSHHITRTALAAILVLSFIRV